MREARRVEQCTAGHCAHSEKAPIRMPCTCSMHLCRSPLAGARLSLCQSIMPMSLKSQSWMLAGEGVQAGQRARTRGNRPGQPAPSPAAVASRLARASCLMHLFWLLTTQLTWGCPWTTVGQCRWAACRSVAVRAASCGAGAGAL